MKKLIALALALFCLGLSSCKSNEATGISSDEQQNDQNHQGKQIPIQQVTDYTNVLWGREEEFGRLTYYPPGTVIIGPKLTELISAASEEHLNESYKPYASESD